MVCNKLVEIKLCHFWNPTFIKIQLLLQEAIKIPLLLQEVAHPTFIQKQGGNTGALKGLNNMHGGLRVFFFF